MVKGKKTSAPKSRKPRVQTTRLWRRIYLKEWREFRGFPTEGLAEKADVSPGLISQIENNKSGGSADTLQKLADALDIEVGELFDVKPEEGGRIARIWISDKDRPIIEEILAARSRIKE